MAYQIVCRFLTLWFLCVFIGFCAPRASLAQATQHIEVPVGNEGYQPTRSQSLTISQGATSVSVKSGHPFTLTSQHLGKQETLLLPDMVMQVTSIHIYKGDHVVVFGEANGSTSIVVVINLDENKIEDQFLCYSPSASPSGQYLAYIKFFPNHGEVNAEDHYMIYDVALSPVANRPPYVRVDDQTNVGRTLFPTGLGNSDGDNVNVGDRPLHGFASDTFFWNSESTSFIFADQFGTTYNIVVANLAPTISVFVSSLAQTAFCGMGEGICFERLSAVKFARSQENTATLTFRGVMGTPATPLIFTLVDTNRQSMRLVKAKAGI